MKPEPQHPGTTRRRFLVGVTAAGVTATATTGRAAPAPVGTSWNLTAGLAYTLFQGNVSVPFARLTGGAAKGALPFLEATEGTDVDVLLDNQLPFAIQPTVVGVFTAPRIEPGTVGSFRFTMPRAGTYLFAQARAPWSGGAAGATVASDLNGLAATIVSRPASGAQELWSGGPAYDREYVLLYEDADDRYNAAQFASSPVSLPPYEPNFFLVNGLAFPGTVADADTKVVGQLGERILLRLGNVGRMRQSIHFHGYHVEPLARNNVPETVWPEKDTLPLPSYATLDLLLVPHQTGVFPLHPHSLTAVTANGLYPYGQLTLIDIR